MRILMFYHSVVSDWNHGNAHFLRGITAELMARGHAVRIYEPEDGWSYSHLVAEHGRGAIRKFRHACPNFAVTRYRLPDLDLMEALDLADLVIVHEWTDPALVRKIGEHHRHSGNYRLLFHDTHHRMVTQPEAMSQFDLSEYDGVLAYGESLASVYRASGRVRQVWTWHEAADTRVFFPRESQSKRGELVWIGNWGDGERTAELSEYLIEPIRELGLRARFQGVGYPREARRLLSEAGIEYAGWLSNLDVPEVFGQFHVTAHVPRRPYVKALPGIPTIRVFEALACGIPLVCSPWDDTEALFKPGRDFLVGRNGREMSRAFRQILNEPDLAESLTRHGLETIRTRHTCAHRVDELLDIVENLKASKTTLAPA